MEKIDLTKRAKRIIKYGLILLIAMSTAAGAGTFKYQHKNDVMRIDNAKVAGTMVSMRVLTNGKIKELTMQDGEKVKAGDVIARLEVSVTEEQIQQLENAVELAKQNYAELQKGQMVKVPVRKPKPKPKPIVQAPQVQTRSSSSNKSLSALEERKNRMEMLFEMGAISRVQRDAAVREYEQAKANSESVEAAPVPVEVPDTTVEYEIEYVDQLQPTPPEILNGAQLAIKQAELSLNVAKQEAQQTEVTAPVDGTIYYTVSVDEEVKAGDVIAKVGDSSELWLEAEVSESQFNKLPLGKLVTYVIDGHSLTGTIIEKREPVKEEPPVETTESAETNQTPPESQAPADAVQLEEKSAPAENVPAELPTGTGGETPAETQNTQPAESQNAQPAANTQPAESQNANPAETPAVEQNKNAGADINPYNSDKYIVKFSIPAERDFDCKPNMTAKIVIRGLKN